MDVEDALVAPTRRKRTRERSVCGRMMPVVVGTCCAGAEVPEAETAVDEAVCEDAPKASTEDTGLLEQAEASEDEEGKGAEGKLPHNRSVGFTLNEPQILECPGTRTFQRYTDTHGFSECASLDRGDFFFSSKYQYLKKLSPH